MKKKLLFTMLCIASALGMNAQTWTGNAPEGGKTFYLYNIESGKFLNNGDPNEEWGTNAYLQAGFGMDIVLEATNSENVYKLNTNVANKTNHHLAESTWCDGAATDWEFRAVTGQTNVYQIVTNGQYIMANGDLNDVEMVGNPGTRASSTYWKLVSEDDFKAAMQAKTFSTTNPMDVSIFIKGRSFARNDGRNNTWTTTHNGGNWVWIGASANKYYGNESWNNTFDVHQTITGLPDGTYEVQCSGFGTNGTTYIYGNNTANLIQTDNTTDYGTNKEAKWKAIHEDNAFAGQTTGRFTVSGGELTVGIKRETNKGGDWAIWDEFRLYYYGLDLSEFAAELAAAVNAAEAVDGTVPTAAYNALAAVVTEQNKTYTTAAQYTAATNAIVEATNTAKTLQSAYARYNKVKEATLALDDDATVFSGNANVNANDAMAVAEAATTVEAINDAIAQLRTIAVNFLGAVTVNEGKFFTITDVFLENTDFSAGNIDGWETNYVSGQQAQNIGYQNNNTYTNADGTVSLIQFIEAWLRAADGTIGDGYLSQTVSGLPEGKYLLEADANAVNQGNPTATATGAYLYINAAGIDYKTSMSTGQDANKNWIPQHFTTEFLSPGGVDVTFGLKTESTSVNWIAADNFVVKYYGKIDLSDFQTQLAEAVAEAQALSGIPTAAYNALMAVVNEKNNTYNNATDYINAISAIQTATNEAKTLQPSYARYNEIKTAVLAAASNTNVTSADNQANDATTNAAIEDAVVTLRDALVTALPNATIPADPGYIDVTAALVDNAGVHTNTEYWTAEGTPNGNYSWAVCNYGECEFYQQNFKFYQTLALGTGTWEFGVTGFHRAGNHNTHFYAGEDQILIPGVGSDVVNTMAEAKDYFDAGNGKVALKFFIENNQNVEIGINNQDTETDRWTIFRDFTLKYYGPENEILEGDLDGNGEVDVTDLSMLVDYLLGKHVEGLAVDPGTVTLKDVTKLVNIIKSK